MNTFFRATLALAITIGAVGFASLPADAQYNGGVNQRQRHQQSRIYNGMGNGSLNGREAARLSRQQFALHQKEQRYRASGNGLSMSERARLQNQQNALSQNIYQQKHDRQGYGNGSGYGNGRGNTRGNSLYDINHTQQQQANRINQGVNSGQLTQSETARLQSQQASLASREAQMRASGGGLSMSERARLDAQQDRLSRNISQQKRDNQTR